MANRSLRAIRTELEFLLDANIISSQQFNTILGQLPNQNSLQTPSSTQQPPVSSMASMQIKEAEPEKRVGYYAETANPPPPAYPSAPAAPPTLAQASALYQYNAQDAGDLALGPGDRIAVTEYMNAEWWKGRNERTGQEGIFPRSYVKVEEKGPVASDQPQPSNYGNMPLDVANGVGSGPGKEPGKGQEMGKKFGKKLGNAAIFGAGATIGGNIVNSIF